MDKLKNAELLKGHSELWAKLYSENIEEHLHAFNETFLAIKKISLELALEELKIHCKAVGGDGLYTKHFIFLMTNGGALSNPDKRAGLYSKIYKEQIAIGKSEIFAHTYSELKASEEYSELGCYSEAAEYEKAITSGFTDKYALAYAMELSEYVANYYSSYEEAIKTELYKIEKARIEKKYSHLR